MKRLAILDKVQVAYGELMEGDWIIGIVGYADPEDGTVLRYQETTCRLCGVDLWWDEDREVYLDDDENLSVTQDETLAHGHEPKETLYMGTYYMGHTESVDLHPDAEYVVIRDHQED